MRKIMLLLTGLILLYSCDRKTPEEKIANLSGYWEIQKAEPVKGAPREFRYSELVDYIEIEDREGFRKKMRPQLDGSFVTSEDQELLSVKVENDSINLYYTTPYTSWKETLISSEEDEIQILNPDGTIYTYKRFTPYSIDHDPQN